MINDPPMEFAVPVCTSDALPPMVTVCDCTVPDPDNVREPAACVYLCKLKERRNIELPCLIA